MRRDNRVVARWRHLDSVRRRIALSILNGICASHEHDDECDRCREEKREDADAYAFTCLTEKDVSEASYHQDYKRDHTQRVGPNGLDHTGYIRERIHRGRPLKSRKDRRVARITNQAKWRALSIGYE